MPEDFKHFSFSLLLDILYLPSIFVLLLWIYGTPIAQHPMLNFDDITLVKPMEKVHNLQDYLEMINENVILDIQPIRDLSYFIEYQIKNLTGYWNPQLDNVLLWVLLLYLVFRLLSSPIPIHSQEGFHKDTPLKSYQKILAQLFCLYLAVHPVAVNTVAWSASRKHLLSGLFAIWTTLTWVRHIEKPSIKLFLSTLCLYALCLLSQPINILWPAWAFLYARSLRANVSSGHSNSYIKSPSIPIAIASFGMVSLIVGYLNFEYYSGPRYIARSVGQKFAPESVSALWDRALVFGRYTYQLLLPTHPGLTPYSIENPLNHIGLIMLVLILVLYFRIRKVDMHIRKFCDIWLVFTILPLILMAIRKTEHPGWDTYLFTPLIGWSIFLFHLSNLIIAKGRTSLSSNHNLKKTYAFGLLILFSLLLFKARMAANAWASDQSMWAQALRIENDHLAVSANAKLAIQSGDMEYGCKLTDQLLERYPKHGALGYLVGRCIYNSRILSADQKLALFKKHNYDLPWFKYYWSALDASQGRFAQADDRLLEMWERKSDVMMSYFSEEVLLVAVRWFAMCTKAKRMNCIDRVNSIKGRFPKMLWDEDKFIKDLDKMGLTNLYFSFHKREK